MLRRKEQIVELLCKGVDGLFRKHKITRYLGYGRLAGPGQVAVTAADGTVQQLAAKHIVLAPGSKPASLPGIELHSDRVGTSTEALSYSEVPKHLVVVGGGYIGMELGSVWNRLGAKVTVLEFLDRILPGTDSELAVEALQLFHKQGFEFRLSTKRHVGEIRRRPWTVHRDLRRGRTIGVRSRPRRRGPHSCHARSRIGDGRNFARQQRAHSGRRSFSLRQGAAKRQAVICSPAHPSPAQEFAPGIYAIGDCIPGPMLAHKAEDDGVACVEGIVTGYAHVDYNLVPSVIYTHPEIAAVGKTEDQLQAEARPYRKGTFPFRANGRARTLADVDGKVKILAHEQTDRVLGVHILGPRAGDLIAEAAAAMAFGASSEDIARTCHAHPTLSEAVREAALAVDGRTINL